jgi:uncharacterized protein
MQILVALVAGLVFGIGLTVAQMVDTAKVLGFLDLGAIPSGGWDPSLALVMAGALAVTAVLFAVARGRGRPFFATELALPKAIGIDRRLLAGALIFGAGWGLVGYCPGPALAALGFGATKTLGFVAAMGLGMMLYHLAFERR